MNTAIRKLFITLILCQAVHSIEEYHNRLWEVLPPARYVSSLFSCDVEKGFILANALLVTFGIICFSLSFQKHPSAFRISLWFWVPLEMGNGFAHIVWSISQGTYRAGLITAPLLLITALFLLVKIVNENPNESS